MHPQPLRICPRDPYSVFDSALYRIHNSRWPFHQEKATIQDVGDVNK
jgi:hypothetical protein